MKRNKVIRWAANVALALGVAGQTGVLRGEGLLSNDGMLAPRSGEIFQTTRMGMGNGAKACSLLTAGGLIAVSEGHPIGWPFAIIGLPFAAVGFVLDEVIVSPLTDIACLPCLATPSERRAGDGLEDEKGIYLSPGLHSEFVGCPDVALKFRKVE